MTTIRYQFTEPELTRELLRYRRPSRLRFWVRVFLVVVGLALLGGRPFVDPDTATFLLLLGAALLAIGAVTLISDPFVARRAYRREVRRHPVMLQPKEAAFDARGLVTVGSHTRLELRWAGVHQLTQDADYLRLFTEGTPVPILLPKRAFAPEELAAFLRCYEQAPKDPPPLVATPPGAPGQPLAT